MKTFLSIIVTASDDAGQSVNQCLTGGGGGGVWTNHHSTLIFLTPASPVEANYPIHTHNTPYGTLLTDIREEYKLVETYGM